MPKKYTHEDYENYLLEKEIDVVPLEPYRGTMVKILHCCFHDHEWMVSPDNIKAGRGCPYCKGNAKKSNVQYLKELKEMHIDIVPLEDLVNMSTPILHKCINGHIWKVKPTHILNSKTNCPDCSTTWGFKNNEPAILYYVRIDSEHGIYYKIGVTNKSIKERFKAEKITVTPIRVVKFKTGKHAKAVELRIIKKYKPITDKRILTSGYSELFEYDIGYGQEN